MEIKISFPIYDQIKRQHESHIISIQVNPYESAINLKSITELISRNYNLNPAEFSLIRNGIQLKSNSEISPHDVLQISPTVLGGKGGFGSLLRAFGKQITMSTNKEACRDLTGRRMRHVNNEKRLQEFLSKQKELAKEKEEKKLERVEKRKKKREKLESTHHLFVDPKYDQQKQKISADVDEALNIAIKKRKLDNEAKKDDENSNGSTSKEEETLEKSPSETETAVEKKPEQPTCSKASKPAEKDITSTKFKDWLGTDDLEVSSSDEDDEKPAKKTA